MDETCCPLYYYMDETLYDLSDYDYPNSTSDYAYYQIFECDHTGGMFWF
jgi:hypothetical protein